MALIDFEVPYAVGWRGKTYQVGLQSIPEELAVALGWSQGTEGEVSESENITFSTSTKRKRTPSLPK